MSVGGRLGITLGALLLVLGLGLGTTASAQAPTVRMVAQPARVAVGAVFRLQIEARVASDAEPEIDLPDLSAFDQVSQPRQSSSVQMRYGIGLANPGIERSYVYVYTLRAAREGTYEIEPARITAGGQTATSGPVTVVVGAGGPPQPAAGAPPPAGARSEFLDGAVVDRTAFLRTTVEPANPYVGQQTTVSVYLYDGGRLRSSRMTQQPTTDGFWTHDLLAPGSSPPAQRTSVEGRTYNVHLLRRFAAFPLESGELTIGAPAVRGVTLNLDRIFGGGLEEELTRTGVPVAVPVRELPEQGRPPGPIHVGSLSLEADLDRGQVATRDAVTLTLRAEGEGRISGLELALPPQPGLRILQPEIEDEVTTDGGTLGGMREMRWLIVPERPGDYTLPAFEVATFDPRQATYRTVRTEPLTLLAAGEPTDPAAGGSVDDAPGPVAPGVAAAFGPIRTRASLRRSHRRLVDEGWFGWTFLIGPLLFGLALSIRVGQRWWRRGGNGAEARGAVRRSRKRLAEARKRMSEGDARGFYAAVATALTALVEAKLARPVGSLTHGELEALLRRRGLDAGLTRSLVDELEGSDFARFSAVGVSPEEMANTLDRARALLSGLDRFRPSPEDDE
ncbi:MAG: BatD family protein [Sandaracinaceae bacterium]